MFNKTKIVLAASIAAASLLGATAAHAATADGDARAEILTAVSVVKQTNSVMNFGQIVPSASAETVVLGPQGGVTCSGTLVCVGTNSAVAFDVTGSAGVAVSAVLPAVDVEISSGANKMVINNFTAFAADWTLGTTGTSFSVGGTLNVKANQAVGVYTGTFPVTVDY